jgi:hypothetical protein
MRYNSIVEERGHVTFPEFASERIYMVEFTKKEGLPFTLSHWQPTVDAMLDGVGTDGPIYLMVDQSFVKKGEFHRRPGLHIDGYWNPGTFGWDTSGHKERLSAGHSYGHTAVEPSGHRSSGGHSVGGAAHTPKPRTKRERDLLEKVERAIKPKKWSESAFSEPEAIILASNICASRAVTGLFDGPIGDMGDCSTVTMPSHYGNVPLIADTVFAGNVTMLHETLAAPFDMERTVVRLNVPGWSP